MSFQPSHRFSSTVRIDEARERRGGFARRNAAATVAPIEAEPDLAESADFYFRRPPRSLGYRHFESAEAALLFARDSLSKAQLLGSVLQVGERRFEGEQVAVLVSRLPARADA